MGSIPYILLADFSLAANGAGSFTYPVPQGQKLTIFKWLKSSTGAFYVTGISDGNGQNYTNATAAKALPSGTVPNVADNYHSIEEFTPPLVIEGGSSLTINVLDASGNPNTSYIVMQCQRDLGV